MMDNQKMTKDMHTKKDAFNKHHNKPSPFVNLFEMKPLRSSKKSSKPISVSLPFKQPQQQVPTHAHHVPANTYQQPQQQQQLQAQQGNAARPRPRFPTRRGGPSLIDKLKKEVAKVSVKNSALDMPRVPPRSYSPPIRSVYSHTSRVFTTLTLTYNTNLYYCRALLGLKENDAKQWCLIRAKTSELHSAKNNASSLREEHYFSLLCNNFINKFSNGTTRNSINRLP